MGGQKLAEVGIQIALEGFHALRSFERFIEAPVGKNHICAELGSRFVNDAVVAGLGGVALFHAEEPIGGGHVIRTALHRDLIGGETEIADGELGVRMSLVDHRFEPRMMLLAVGEPAADDGDVVVFLKSDERLRSEAGSDE